FTLLTPYLYDNTQNLVVEVSHGGYSTGFSIAQATVTGKSVFGNSSATSGSIQDRLVHFGFDTIPSTPCSGAVTAGTASATVVNACGAVPFNLSLTGATNAGGITYQWQSS